MADLQPAPLSDDVELDVEADGRRARRDRNRDAVVDAMLDLHREGDLDPNVADIAERSGVSHRSVFRYFDDLEELFRVAIAKGNERYAELLHLHEIGQGPLDDRIERIIEQRMAFFEEGGPTGLATRLRAPFEPVLQKDLVRTRARMRDQLARHFAAELKQLGRAGAQRLAAIDVLLSLESYQLLRDDQVQSLADVADTWRSALTALLR